VGPFLREALRKDYGIDVIFEISFRNYFLCHPERSRGVTILAPPDFYIAPNYTDHSSDKKWDHPLTVNR
jgi:hypothetical protein